MRNLIAGTASVALVFLSISPRTSSAQTEQPAKISGQQDATTSSLTSDSYYERFKHVSLVEEQRLANRLLPLYLKRYGLTPERLIRRGQRSQYIRDVSSGLPAELKHAERYPRLDVAYIPSDKSILFALPGGTLVASRERFTGTLTEDALFGAIAHEMSLVDRGAHLELLFDDQGNRKTVDSLTDAELTAWVSGQFPTELEELVCQDVHRRMKACFYDPEKYAEYLDYVARINATAEETKGIDLETWRVDHAIPKKRAALLRKFNQE